MIAFTDTPPATILPLGLVKFLLFYTKLHHFYHANFVLHSGHHDQARSSWEFGECKLIIIAINPPFVNLNILMMGASIRFICLASCMVFHRFGWIILHPAHKLFMWVLLLLKHQTTQQSTQFVDCCIMPICHDENLKCICGSMMCGLDMIIVVANIIKNCFR